MTIPRKLFLEGNRIVDEDGGIVRELTPEDRQLLLRMARMRALHAQEVPPEDDPFLGPIIARARRIVEGMSPEEREARRERVQAIESDTRRRAEALLPLRLAEYERRMTAMEQAISDDAAARIPLRD